VARKIAQKGEALGAKLGGGCNRCGFLLGNHDK
jgi:hypothetical protein